MTTRRGERGLCRVRGLSSFLIAWAAFCHERVFFLEFGVVDGKSLQRESGVWKPDLNRFKLSRETAILLLDSKRVNQKGSRLGWNTRKDGLTRRTKMHLV